MREEVREIWSFFSFLERRKKGCGGCEEKGETHNEKKPWPKGLFDWKEPLEKRKDEEMEIKKRNNIWLVLLTVFLLLVGTCTQDNKQRPRSTVGTLR